MYHYLTVGHLYTLYNVSDVVSALTHLGVENCIWQVKNISRDLKAYGVIS